MSLWERASSGARAWLLGSGQATQTSWLWPYDNAVDEDISYGEHLKLTNAVYVCAKKRADYLASLPLKVYRGQGDKRTEVTTGPLVELLDRVNPFWTFGRLLRMTEMSLCVWGDAFWFLERGTSGKRPPMEIWWARPDRVKVVPSETDYISHFEYTPPGASEPVRFSRDETIWLGYPNPNDEFCGLSPLQAAAITSELNRNAQVSNAAMFRNGMNIAGVIVPKPANGTMILPENHAKELEQQLAKRFRGAEKAHRVAVLRYEADFKAVSFSPKDAEFLGALNWSLEEIARAYGVPLDLIGGQRTYANLEASRLSMWQDTILPEADFIATELTEQLLPMFGAMADSCGFDSSRVEVLQEAKAMRWDRISDQIAKGAIIVNEWRESEGLDPLPWGGEWWAPATLVPVGTSGAEMQAAKDAKAAEIAAAMKPTAEVQPPDQPKALPEGKAAPQAQTRAITYGSPEHEQIWRMMVRRTEPHERAFGKMTADLMRSQKQAVMSRLKGRAARVAKEVADDPFDLPAWIKKFREASRPLLLQIVEDAGTATLADLALSISFDIKDPNVTRFLEGRAQRFAREVNETTWADLKASLVQGIDGGETIPQLADRVEAVMGDRIQSSGTTIARTEVIGASNGGTIEGYRQSGVVTGKEWLAALDDRTRETHIEAHGQRVGLDEDFTVGDGSGPAPGQIGVAEEDINCRCSTIPILDIDPRQPE